MKQVIVDLGIVDAAAHRALLRLVGYALMVLGGLGLGFFLQRLFSLRSPGRSLAPYGMLAFTVGLLAGLYAVMNPVMEFALAGYILFFAAAFAAGAGLALWRERKAKAGEKNQATEKTRAQRLEMAINLVTVLTAAGGGVMVLDLAGFSVPLRVHGYGLMLVLGFLAGILVAQWFARRAGENPQVITHIGLLALAGGIGGSRLAYVVKYWDRFASAERPLVEVLNVSSGGLIYYGGLLLATALVLGYLRRKRLPVRRYLDLVTVSLMIGLAFGRAGCTLNGCCFGELCRPDWPLAMRFPMFSKPLVKLNDRDNPFASSVDTPSPVYAHQMRTGRVQPPPSLLRAGSTQPAGPGELLPPHAYDPEQIALAEAQWSDPVKPAELLALFNALVLAGLLAAFHRLRRREGQTFALLLILYPITRFVLESLRGDNVHDLAGGVLTHNQYTSLVILLAGVIMMIVLQRCRPSAGPTWTDRLAAESANKKKPRT